MALAALAPLLGSIIAPSAFSALGLSMPTALAAAIGGGLGGWAATGNATTGLEDAALGGLGSWASQGLGGILGGGNSAAGLGGGAANVPAGAMGGGGLGDMPSFGGTAGALGGSFGAGPVGVNPMLAANAGGPASAQGIQALMDPTGGGLSQSLPSGLGSQGSAPGGGLMSWMGAHPLMTGLGGALLLGALGNNGGNGNKSTNVPQLKPGPGLIPYQQRTYNPTPAGFQPGVSPEWNYFTPQPNFAEGGMIQHFDLGGMAQPFGSNDMNRGFGAAGNAPLNNSNTPNFINGLSGLGAPAPAPGQAMPMSSNISSTTMPVSGQPSPMMAQPMLNSQPTMQPRPASPFAANLNVPATPNMMGANMPATNMPATNMPASPLAGPPSPLAGPPASQMPMLQDALGALLPGMGPSIANMFSGQNTASPFHSMQNRPTAGRTAGDPAVGAAAGATLATPSTAKPWGDPDSAFNNLNNQGGQALLAQHQPAFAAYKAAHPGGYSGFASGGMVAPLDLPPPQISPYIGNPPPGMLALQLGMNPSQMMQQQLFAQQISPTLHYAGGGQTHISGAIPADQKGNSFLNREIMRNAMIPQHNLPISKPPLSGSFAPDKMGSSTHVKFPDMAGGGPVMGNGIAGAGGPPGMLVPDSAGDGSSDNIPATIDGNQPALLSSNEFVVPSDAVAHIGNGSSASGAKKLHAMVARVRQAKTGSPKMPGRINARSMMPA